jgi:hypothetical protein
VQWRLRLFCVAAAAVPAQLGHQQRIVLVRVGAEGEQVADVLTRYITEVLLQPTPRKEPSMSSIFSIYCLQWVLVTL